MSPDRRREAIIAATIPLIRRYGLNVSTSQIADAAGIAEGTIFRVFDDKATLVRQTIEAALHPGDVERQLAAIGRSLPLRERIIAAAEILQVRLTSVFELLTAVGMTRPPGDDDCHHRPPHHAGIMVELARLFELDRDQLRCPPPEAARLLRVITFAGSHPGINDGHPLNPIQIVDLVLDGIRDHSARDPLASDRSGSGRSGSGPSVPDQPTHGPSRSDPVVHDSAVPDPADPDPVAGDSSANDPSP